MRTILLVSFWAIASASKGFVDFNGELEIKYHVVDNNTNIPNEFDARNEWPDCPSIKEIPDVSGCDSTWAVSAAACMSDRICIHRNETNKFVSANNLIACCPTCGFKCGGGFPIFAWKYWMENGIATGGAYGTNTGCQAYPFAPCTHNLVDNRTMECQEKIEISNPVCVKECDQGTSLVYEDELTYGDSYYRLDINVTQIQLEIMQNGPVQAEMTINEDFVSYKSGVYVASNDTYTIGSDHSVRIIGWGVENGVDYWLVANPWNSNWGDEGFFKIIRGVDHCGIESQITVGMPKL